MKLDDKGRALLLITHLVHGQTSLCEVILMLISLIFEFRGKTRLRRFFSHDSCLYIVPFIDFCQRATSYYDWSRCGNLTIGLWLINSP